MKRLFPAILSLILLLSVSCSKEKGLFILHGTVLDGSDSILVVGLDNRLEDVDTIFCHEGQFTWNFRPDTVTTLILILPDGRRHPVFAEKDVESFMTIPADTGLFNVSGGFCNDAYQSFYIASLKDSTLDQAANRIDSFITRDPFSEVTPYLIYDRMVQTFHADQNKISALIKRMSGNMQDAPYIVALSAEFKGDIPNNQYISSLYLQDSVGVRYQFTNIGGQTNYLLVCVWSTWSGDSAIRARRAMKPVLERFAGRSLDVTDVSVDVNWKRWKDVITADTLNWISYIDTNGMESRLIKNSNVQHMPVYLLFSSVKRVVYKATSVDDLCKELERILPKEKPKEEPKKTNNSTNNKRTQRTQREKAPQTELKVLPIEKKPANP